MQGGGVGAGVGGAGVTTLHVPSSFPSAAIVVRRSSCARLLSSVVVPVGWPFGARRPGLENRLILRGNSLV